MSWGCSPGAVPAHPERGWAPRSLPKAAGDPQVLPWSPPGWVQPLRAPIWGLDLLQPWIPAWFLQGALAVPPLSVPSFPLCSAHSSSHGDPAGSGGSCQAPPGQQHGAPRAGQEQLRAQPLGQQQRAVGKGEPAEPSPPLGALRGSGGAGRDGSIPRGMQSPVGIASSVPRALSPHPRAQIIACWILFAALQGQVVFLGIVGFVLLLLVSGGVWARPQPRALVVSWISGRKGICSRRGDPQGASPGLPRPLHTGIRWDLGRDSPLGGWPWIPGWIPGSAQGQPGALRVSLSPARAVFGMGFQVHPEVLFPPARLGLSPEAPLTLESPCLQDFWECLCLQPFPAA